MSTQRLAGAVLALLIVTGCGAGSQSGTRAPNDPGTASSAGLPLTAAQRDAFRQRAEPLYQAVTADPNRFAGIYSTDEGGRWRIVVRYVTEVPPPEATSLVDADIPVDWVQAKYSMSQLVAVANELLIGLQSEIRAERVSQVTPDEATNTVMIGLPVDDVEIRTRLTDRYRDLVSFKTVSVFRPIE